MRIRIYPEDGGFILIELLVVIGIISILAGLIMPFITTEPVTASAPSRTIIAADAHWYGEHNQGHPKLINVLYKSGSMVELKLGPQDTWEKITKGRLKK